MNDQFPQAGSTRASRRAVLGTVGAIGATGLAGCLDRIPFLGDDPIEFSAEPVSVSANALDETGYEEQESGELTIERTYEAAGQSQDVVVTNWQAEYDKSVDGDAFGLPIGGEYRGAVFTALSTPQVSVLDRTFNPVGEMESEELAEMVQDRYEGMGDLSPAGEEQVTILGETTTVGEFITEASVVNDNAQVEIRLHIAEAVESGDDFVVGIGGYPTALEDEERPNVTTLLESIEH